MGACRCSHSAATHDLPLSLVSNASACQSPTVRASLILFMQAGERPAPRAGTAVRAPCLRAHAAECADAAVLVHVDVLNLLACRDARDEVGWKDGVAWSYARTGVERGGGSSKGCGWRWGGGEDVELQLARVVICGLQCSGRR
eukprot:2285096-Pleurochrysis_carterae.AAC.2